MKTMGLSDRLYYKWINWLQRRNEFTHRLPFIQDVTDYPIVAKNSRFEQPCFI